MLRATKRYNKHIEQLNSCAHIQGNAHNAQPYHRQSSNQIISLHFVHGKVGWVECTQGLASLFVSFPAGYIADKKGPFKMRRIADGYTVSILQFIVHNPSSVFDIQYTCQTPRRSFRRVEDRGCLLCTSHHFDDHYAIVSATVFPKRSRFAMIFARYSSTYSLSCTI